MAKTVKYGGFPSELFKFYLAPNTPLPVPAFCYAKEQVADQDQNKFNRTLGPTAAIVPHHPGRGTIWGYPIWYLAPISTNEWGEVFP